MARLILIELRIHAPFTFLGSLSGLLLMGVIVYGGVPSVWSARLFWTLHPLHVFLSAFATVGMYRRHKPAGIGMAILVGYLGSIGVATLSDCVIPYVGEGLLGLPNKGWHLGFIEKWWLVNPLAAVGIIGGYFWPGSKVAHSGHVMISTWASLFHMTMALNGALTGPIVLLALLFLFLAVWIPCCTSDIVFPVLFTGKASLPGRRFHRRAQRFSA